MGTDRNTGAGWIAAESIRNFGSFQPKCYTDLRPDSNQLVKTRY